MSFQRDYILRMIEMMGEFFRRLGDMMDEREQLGALDALCREHCGVPLDTARELSMETLSDLLTSQARFVLSEILFLRAQVLVNKDDQKAEDLLRCTHLMLTLCNDISFCSERSARLKELLSLCADSLTADDYLNAARFFMTGEHYDDCEDMIFLSVQCARDTHFYTLEGMALLTRMRLLPEDSLLPGGMSRADVDRAINDLNKIDSKEENE